MRSSATDLSEIPIFILAGGLGTRISEESHLKPKPLIELGGLPILLHVMRHYYACGFSDFVICAGYRAADIKNYFLDYQYLVQDVEIDFRQEGPPVTRPLTSEEVRKERWRVRILDTGLQTMTGGRICRALDAISQISSFSTLGLTYADGLTDADLAAELRFHEEQGRIGTVMGVRNIARFGELDIQEGNRVASFLEKPASKQGFINGGFFFFSSRFRQFLSPQESLVLEKDPLSKLALQGELSVFTHQGFWHAMDTLRDKHHLESLWSSGKAPWRSKREGEELASITPIRRAAGGKR